MTYGRVPESVWSEQGFRGLSEDGRAFDLYLKTCPHRNRLGIFVLDPLYASADLQWEVVRVHAAVAELEDAGRIGWDAEARVILVRDALRVDPIQNGNVAKGALRDLESVPDTPLLGELEDLVLETPTEGWSDSSAEVFDRLLGSVRKRFQKACPKGLGNRSETVSERSGTPALSSPDHTQAFPLQPRAGREGFTPEVESVWAVVEESILEAWHLGSETIRLPGGGEIGMGAEKRNVAELVAAHGREATIGVVRAAPALFAFDEPHSLRWLTSEEHGSPNFERAEARWRSECQGPTRMARDLAAGMRMPASSAEAV